MYRSKIAFLFLSFLNGVFSNPICDNGVSPENPVIQKESASLEVITEQPQVVDITTIKDQIHSFLASHPRGSLTPLQWHSLALLYIKAADLDRAIQCLQYARSTEPPLFQINTQLGFVFLWENDLEDAYIVFSIALKQAPYNKDTLLGLDTIAQVWFQEKTHQKPTIEIYQVLHDHSPNNVDYLFHLGVLLARDSQWDKAEELLKKCLTLAPQNTEAAVQLEALYLWQGKFDLVEEIYRNYPNIKRLKTDHCLLELPRCIDQK